MRLKTTAMTAAMLGAVIAAAGPAAAQTYLDQLLAKVLRPKGATAGAGEAAPATALAAITPAQEAAIDRLLAVPVQMPGVAADRAQAAPLIRALLVIGSCAKGGEAFNGLARRMMAPRSLDGFTYAAMPKLRYHDRQTCLDVARIASWHKPALNALAFTAYYVAPDSGEAAHQDFVVQKATDGEWLIRDVMPTGE